MYLGDKTQRITLRLSDAQFSFVKLNADCLGVSPSDFLRMVINSAISSQKGGGRRENESDNIDNIL